MHVLCSLSTGKTISPQNDQVKKTALKPPQTTDLSPLTTDYCRIALIRRIPEELASSFFILNLPSSPV